MAPITYGDLQEGQFPNYDSSALGFRRESDISKASVLSGIYSRNPALALAVQSIRNQYGGEIPKKQPNERISQILATVEPYVLKDYTTGQPQLNDQGYALKGVRPPADVKELDFLLGVKALGEEFPNARPFKGKKMGDVTLSTVAKENRLRYINRMQDLLRNETTGGFSLMGRVDEDTNLTGVGDWESSGTADVPDVETKRIKKQNPLGQFAYSETIPAGFETGDDIYRFVSQQPYTNKRLGSTEMYLPEKVEKVGTKRTPFGVQNPLPGGGLMGLPSEARQEIESMAMGRLNAGEMEEGSNAAVRAIFNRANIRQSDPALIPAIVNTHELPTGEIIQKVSSPGFVQGKIRPIEGGATKIGATNFTSRTPESYAGGYNEEGEYDWRNKMTDINRSNIDMRGGGYAGDPTPMLPPPTGNPIARERPEINLFDESDIGRGYNSRNSVTGTAYVEHPTALAATRFAVDVPPEKELNSVFAKIMELPGANEPMLADRSQRRGKGISYDKAEPDYSPAQQYLTNIGRGLGPDTVESAEIADFLRGQGVKNARTPEGKPSGEGTDTYTLGLSTAGKIHEAINKVDEDYRDVSNTRRNLNTLGIQGLAEKVAATDPEKITRVAEYLDRTSQQVSPAEMTSLLMYDAKTGSIRPEYAKLEPQLSSLEKRESEARDRAVSLNRKQEVLQNYGFTPDTEGLPGTSGSSTYRNLDLDWQIAKQGQDNEIGKGEWRGTVNELGGKRPMVGDELSEWAASADARSQYGLTGMAEAAVTGGRSVPNPAAGQPLVFQEIGGISQDRPVVREPASPATQAIRYRMANPDVTQRSVGIPEGEKPPITPGVSANTELLDRIVQDIPIARAPESEATKRLRYKMANPPRVQREIGRSGSPVRQPQSAQVEGDLLKVARAKRR